MNDVARNMLTSLYTVGFRVHWKVWVLICTEHIVGFKIWILALLTPYSADGRLCLQNNDVGIGIYLQICCGDSKTVPSYRD